MRVMATTGIVTPIAIFTPEERPLLRVDAGFAEVVLDTDEVDVAVVETSLDPDVLVVVDEPCVTASKFNISLSVDSYATIMGFARTV
jgi:hypothetical protein